jgi:tetratricopeptide (TPR) repeat protein
VKIAIIMAIVLGMAANVMADFAEDFQAAKKLFKKKDYEAAHQTFVKLAASAPNGQGKAESLSYAAMALGRRKQYDQALELAKTIEAKPVAAYTQMAIMNTNPKQKELIAAFKDEDIGAWPDRINYKGFQLRGAAYIVTKDRQPAVKDFERCVELAGSDIYTKLEALNDVAGLYHVLKDDAKAMDSYQKAFAIYDDDPDRKGRGIYPTTLLAAARVLKDQKKYDEALAILAKLPPRHRRNVYGFLFLEAYGDICIEQGKKDEALAKYQDAVTIKTHQVYIDRVNKKVESLKTEGINK